MASGRGERAGRTSRSQSGELYMALITEATRRGSALYRGTLDRRVSLEKLTNYQRK